MTLIPYKPEEFDRLALRFLDLAAVLRGIAEKSRSESLTEIAIHDKKANEWLDKLELWAEETRQRTELAAMRSLGARKAKEMLDEAEKKVQKKDHK